MFLSYLIESSKVLRVCSCYIFKASAGVFAFDGVISVSVTSGISSYSSSKIFFKAGSSLDEFESKLLALSKGFFFFHVPLEPNSASYPSLEVFWPTPLDRILLLKLLFSASCLLSSCFSLRVFYCFP